MRDKMPLSNPQIHKQQLSELCPGVSERNQRTCGLKYEVYRWINIWMAILS